MGKKKKKEKIIKQNEIIENNENIEIIDDENVDENTIIEESQILAINDESRMKITEVIFIHNKFSHLRVDIDSFLSEYKQFIDGIYGYTRNYTFDNYIKRVSNNAIENLINKLIN